MATTQHNMFLFSLVKMPINWAQTGPNPIKKVVFIEPNYFWYFLMNLGLKTPRLKIDLRKNCKSVFNCIGLSGWLFLTHELRHPNWDFHIMWKSTPNYIRKRPFDLSYFDPKQNGQGSKFWDLFQGKNRYFWKAHSCKVIGPTLMKFSMDSSNSMPLKAKWSKILISKIFV